MQHQESQDHKDFIAQQRNGRLLYVNLEDLSRRKFLDSLKLLIYIVNKIVFPTFLLSILNINKLAASSV